MKIINLTKKDVKVSTSDDVLTFTANPDREPQVITAPDRDYMVAFNGGFITVKGDIFKGVVNLPPKKPGTILIVPHDVALAERSRDDLVVPAPGGGLRRVTHCPD